MSFSISWLVEICLGKVLRAPMMEGKDIKSSVASRNRPKLRIFATIIHGNLECICVIARICGLHKFQTTATWGHFSEVASKETIFQKITFLIGIKSWGANPNCLCFRPPVRQLQTRDHMISKTIWVRVLFGMFDPGPGQTCFVFMQIRKLLNLWRSRSSLMSIAWVVIIENADAPRVCPTLCTTVSKTLLLFHRFPWLKKTRTRSTRSILMISSLD